MARYRSEIDGLRAVAIIPVVLFHAGLASWSGGFIGVDVFFVISGYVITATILDPARRGEFRFRAFYERRIRRLVPALILMVVATWIGATLLLDQDGYEEFAQSVLSVFTATANWFFFFQVDYFDGAAETKPLLHMWSLAVEEQFYLLFPLLLVFGARWSSRRLLTVIVLLGAASLGYAIYAMAVDQEGTFYHSGARFWELLIGVALAIYGREMTSPRWATAARYGGIAMIGVAVFAYDSATPFPGVAALLPTLGAALVIWAGSGGKDLVLDVLRSEPFVQIGKVSYGWYLWHWPLLVLVPLAVQPEPDAALQLSLIIVAASLAVAFVSYWAVEQPVRKKQWPIRGRKAAAALFAASLATTVVLALPGFIPALSEARLLAVRGSVGVAVAVISEERDYYMRIFNRNFNGRSPVLNAVDGNIAITCSFDRDNDQERLLDCLTKQAAPTRNVLVIGDSVGRDTFHSLRLAYPEQNFLMIHHSGCPPAAAGSCFPGLQVLINRLLERIPIDAAVLAFRFRPRDWQTVTPSLRVLPRKIRRVVMIGPGPVYSQPIAAFLESRSTSDTIPATVATNDQRMVGWDFAALSAEARALAGRHGVVFVNTIDDWCPEQACGLWADATGEKPLLWDELHLTRYGIGFLSNVLGRDAELLAVLSPHSNARTMQALP